MDKRQQDNFRALLTEAIIKLCQMEAVYTSELRIEGTVCVVSDCASVMIAHFTECVGNNHDNSECVFDQCNDDGLSLTHTELMLPELKVQHVLPDEIIKTFEDVSYSDDLSVMHGFCQEAEMNSDNNNAAVDIKKSSGGKYQCPSCHKTCKLKRTLQLHMKRHHECELQRCQQCSATFTSLATLHEHITSEHGNWCDGQLSGSESAGKSRMQYHKDQHHDVVLKTEQDDNVEHEGCLAANICMPDSAEVTDSCLEADSADSLALLKALERKDYEKMRGNTHLLTKDTNITDNQAMQQLSESHMSTAPETQSKYWNDGKASIMQYFEKVHVETPQGLYKYKCCLCHKMFKIRTSLYEHINSHIGKRRYACSHCGDRFVHHSSLHNHVNNKHMLIGQQIFMRYQCTGCDRGFKFRSQFERHLRSYPDHNIKSLMNTEH